MIILRKPGRRIITVIIADEIGGVRDGSNQVFTTTYDYEPHRINFFYNGQALHSPDDFTETGSNEVTLKYIYPDDTDELRADYEMLGGTTVSGNDHGLLIGLLDDDHPQYHNDARGDARYYIKPTVDALLAAQDEFIELLDTPTTYSGSEGKYVTVKSDGTGLEFSDVGVEQVGTTAINDGVSSVTVTFSSAFANTDYIVTLGLQNTAAEAKSVYAMLISNKTVAGFTVLFSGDIDSSSYKFNWIAKAS
jgi:hypothetical protein